MADKIRRSGMHASTAYNHFTRLRLRLWKDSEDLYGEWKCSNLPADQPANEVQACD